MTDYEEPIASEVLRLLRSAKLQPNDGDLANAAELAGPEKNTTVRPRDSLRGEVHLAIQRLRMAISKGASAADAELLRQVAVAEARSWLTARS